MENDVTSKSEGKILATVDQNISALQTLSLNAIKNGHITYDAGWLRLRGDAPICFAAKVVENKIVAEMTDHFALEIDMMHGWTMTFIFESDKCNIRFIIPIPGVNTIDGPNQFLQTGIRYELLTGTMHRLYNSKWDSWTMMLDGEAIRFHHLIHEPYFIPHQLFTSALSHGPRDSNDNKCDWDRWFDSNTRPLPTSMISKKTESPFYCSKTRPNSVLSLPMTIPTLPKEKYTPQQLQIDAKLMTDLIQGRVQYQGYNQDQLRNLLFKQLGCTWNSYATTEELRDKIKEYIMAYRDNWLYTPKFNARCPSKK